MPVFGRKKGGNSLEISFFIKNKNMTPVIAKQISAITEYIKYSENISIEEALSPLFFLKFYLLLKVFEKAG